MCTRQSIPYLLDGYFFVLFALTVVAIFETGWASLTAVYFPPFRVGRREVSPHFGLEVRRRMRRPGCRCSARFMAAKHLKPHGTI